MRCSLALKLVLSFLLVIVTSTALAAVIARWATFREFDRLVLGEAESSFIEDVTAYYETIGSWEGVARHLPPRAPAPQPRPGDIDQPPPPQAPLFAFALADQNGYVVVPAGPYRVGDRVPTTQMAQGTALEIDGPVVGTVLTTGEPPSRSPLEEIYLARTNRALLGAALGSVALAIVLGVFLARALTRPLRQLTTATQAVTRGELGQQVPVRSQDELGELAAAFNKMSADLARANGLRRQMTADIAHDLRTPLTVMAGYLEALRDGVLKPSPERFETMHLEAQHLRRLVEDLRTLSLADAGELALNCEPVSPRSVLEQAAAACQYQAEQQGIALKVDATPRLPRISVDPDRIAQVLGNLVSNALRHTPAGEQICLGAAQEGDHVLLTVQDTGSGISPDELPHVFDRFYRGGEAREGDSGESGLGLTIARSLVGLQGGTISVESLLGQGTMFTIVLPGCEAWIGTAADEPEL